MLGAHLLPNTRRRPAPGVGTAPPVDQLPAPFRAPSGTPRIPAGGGHLVHTATVMAATSKSSESENPLVLRSSRRKWAGVLALSLAFTVAGMAMVAKHDALGWLAAVFFGACSVVAAVMLIRPARLRITDREMVLDQWWRHYRYDFLRCGEFRVWRAGPGQSTVTFDYDGRKLHTHLVGVNRALGARSQSLPDTFGVRPSELAQLLNERRTAVLEADRASSREGQEPPEG